jgi:hypothetical protein
MWYEHSSSLLGFDSAYSILYSTYFMVPVIKLMGDKYKGEYNIE